MNFTRIGFGGEFSVTLPSLPFTLAQRPSYFKLEETIDSIGRSVAVGIGPSFKR